MARPGPSPPTARRRTGGYRLVPTAVGLLVLSGVVALGIGTGQPAPSPMPLPSATTPATSGGDIYVAPEGSDAATGTAANPRRTLSAALAIVEPGATVWLMPGTYAASAIGRSGEADAPITIAAAGPGAATIDGAQADVAIDVSGVHDVRLIGLDVDGPDGSGLTAIRVERSQRIEILGGQVRDTRGGFGIDVRYSSAVTIRGVDVAHNGVGIRLYGEGDPASVHDVLVEQNAIHDSDSMIVNDPAPDNDFGANGIIWHKVTGSTVARDNQVWSNRADSHDYGTDGGAFEIWASSNMRITGNTAWNNVNVMETGSDGTPCVNIVYDRNVAFVTTNGVGLILRCAQDSLVAHNVFDRMEHYAFELSDAGSGNHFATSIAGLRILDNIVAGSRVYSILTPLPDSVQLDYTLAWETGGTVVSLPIYGDQDSLEQFAHATGQETHGQLADPRFVDRAGHDYRVAIGSPAIDAGIPALPGETYVGAAPDIGRYEGGVALPSAS